MKSSNNIQSHSEESIQHTFELPKSTDITQYIQNFIHRYPLQECFYENGTIITKSMGKSRSEIFSTFDTIKNKLENIIDKYSEETEKHQEEINNYKEDIIGLFFISCAIDDSIAGEILNRIQDIKYFDNNDKKKLFLAEDFLSPESRFYIHARSFLHVVEKIL